MLERPINELCAQADDAYRKTSRHAAPDRYKETRGHPIGMPAVETMGGTIGGEAGLALRAAAMQAGEYEAFRRITAALRQEAPEIADALGLRN
jgi:hypothetical protein